MYGAFKWAGSQQTGDNVNTGESTYGKHAISTKTGVRCRRQPPPPTWRLRLLTKDVTQSIRDSVSVALATMQATLPPDTCYAFTPAELEHYNQTSRLHAARSATAVNTRNYTGIISRQRAS